jgi:hypothetical protein
MTDLAVLAAVVLAYALVSRRLERTAISTPMIFVAAGLLVSPRCLDLADGGIDHDRPLDRTPSELPAVPSPVRDAAGASA